VHTTPLGLLTASRTFSGLVVFPGSRSRFSAATICPPLTTLCPSRIFIPMTAGSPSTVTFPSKIRRSACLREQIPMSLKYLFKRISSIKQSSPWPNHVPGLTYFPGLSPGLQFLLYSSKNQVKKQLNLEVDKS
jgi:hypothetical protein